MTTMTALDFRNYVQSVGIATAHIFPLSRKLANAAPADADPLERAALTRIAEAAHAVRDVLTERDRFSPSRVRPFLNAHASAWSGVHGALAALAGVPSHVSPRGARAGEILSSLFPDGVAFVKQDAVAAWSEGQRRLDRIESEGLRPEIDQLVGPDFVAAALSASHSLANAIGVTPGAREPAVSASLRETRGRFSKAVAVYCRILAAKVDEDDPGSVDRFRTAVAAVDELRIIRERGEEEEEAEDGGGEPPATDPTAPAPA